MILNRQRGVRVPVRELDRFLARALRRVRLSSSSLTVCFVDAEEIARWNRAYRGKKGPTDVLSFPADTTGAHRRNRHERKPVQDGSSYASPPSSASAASYLGDIAIAPSVARRNARQFGRSLPEEMRILILHGILHLMGYDHETDNGQMDRREQRLRRDLRLA